MAPIRSVANDVCVRVEMFFRFEQLPGRDNHEIGATEKIVLEGFQSVRRAGEGGIFVNAIIDQLALAETTRDHTRGWVKYYVDDFRKPEPPYRLLDLADEQAPIQRNDH